jgi:hypothetical protein
MRRAAAEARTRHGVGTRGGRAARRVHGGRARTRSVQRGGDVCATRQRRRAGARARRGVVRMHGGACARRLRAHGGARANA